MYRIVSQSALAPAVWLAVLTLAACGDGSRSEAARDTTAATTGMAADTAPAMSDTEAKLTDANIVALLDEANQADSAAGAAAHAKATDKAVKDFASLMMSEHHAMRQEGQQLAKKLGVTPEPPADDPLKTLAESEMATLGSTPKGAKFDQVYIEQEIAAHKAVLDVAGKGHDQAQNEQLKALIEKAKPVVQKHLDKAEEIQSKLGKATT